MIRIWEVTLDRDFSALYLSELLSRAFLYDFLSLPVLLPLPPSLICLTLFISVYLPLSDVFTISLLAPSFYLPVS